MNSPLVTRLISDLAATTDIRRRALVSAELGRYWARVGEFEEAERIRLELRRDFGDGHDVRVSILIMVIEALQLYYRDLSPHARDRMARACLLSKAARDQWLIALSAAWMAHIEFNHNRFDSMVLELATSWAAMDSQNPEAECRAAIVLGDAFLFVGQTDLSQGWYERAHRAAVRQGDRAAIGAMTYNRAAFRVARARFDRICSPECALDLSLLRLDVESAINYQLVARLRSLDHLLTTTRVGLLMLQERFDEALSPIEETLASPGLPQGSAQQALLHADYALCLAKVGRESEATRHLGAEAFSRCLALEADDRCLALASLLDASKIVTIVSPEVDFGVELADAVSQHQSFAADLFLKLERFATSTVPAGQTE